MLYADSQIVDISREGIKCHTTTWNLSGWNIEIVEIDPFIANHSDSRAIPAWKSLPCFVSSIIINYALNRISTGIIIYINTF